MMKRPDTGSIFAECQECMTGYWRPDMQETFRTEDLEWRSEPASMDEVLQAGWPLLEERP